MTQAPLTLGLLLLVGSLATAWDLRTRTLPDWLTLGALGTFLGLAALQGNAFGGALGAVLPSGLLLLVALLAGGGLGGGDVKYLAAIGAALGPLGGLLALLASALIGTLQGAVTALRGKDAYPFGPALAAGSLLAPLLWPYVAPVLFGR